MESRCSPGCWVWIQKRVKSSVTLLGKMLPVERSICTQIRKLPRDPRLRESQRNAHSQAIFQILYLRAKTVAVTLPRVQVVTVVNVDGGKCGREGGLAGLWAGRTDDLCSGGQKCQTAVGPDYVDGSVLAWGHGGSLISISGFGHFSDLPRLGISQAHCSMAARGRLTLFNRPVE
jgi:hypothetical protein